MKYTRGSLFFFSCILICSAQNWAPQDSGTTENLTDVHFVSEQVGYVSGAFGTILKTLDGGQSWEPLKSPSGESFTAIAALDASRVISGRNGLFRSTNGGTDWQEIGAFSTVASSIFDIDFVSATTGYLVKRGLIFQTDDGGETWREIYREQGQWFLDRLHTPEPTVLYATGGFTRSEFFGFASVGFVVRSRNVGRDWELLSTPEVSDVMAASWVNATLGFLFTFTGPIHRTEDGGETWKELTTNFDQLGQPLVTGAQFYDASQGWAVTFDGRILGTSDGGLTWTVEAEVPSQAPLSAIHMVSNKIGFVVGNDGAIYKLDRSTAGVPLRLSTVRFDEKGQQLEVTVAGNPGTVYQLESSPNLMGPWKADDESTVLKESPTTITVPAERPGHQFYRLSTQPADLIHEPTDK